MKKIIIVLIVILLVALAVKLSSSKTTSIPQVQTDNTNAALETKENSEGAVVVAVTPQNLEQNSLTWDFKIKLNTHSEELDMDLVAVSELVDEQGKLYKSTSWEGAAPGGHHREGVLKFNPISPKPKSIELRLKNIGGIEERVFKWIF